MRKAVLVFLLLSAQTLLAASADLKIVSFFPTRTSLESGERFSVTMRWRNDGPDAAHDVVASLGISSGAFVVTGAGTSNWPCEPSFGNEGFTCRGTIAAGGEAEMVVTMLAPPRSGTWSLRGDVSASTTDPQPGNNVAETSFSLAQAAAGADLVASFTQQYEVARGGHLTFPVNIANRGPATLQDVRVSLAFEPGTRIPITASGEGWACANATHSPWLVTCTRSQLAASNTLAPIAIDVAAVPSSDASLRFAARVAAQGHWETAPGNELAIATIRVGSPEVFSRVLIPLVPAETPGADGALWKAETTLMLRAPAEIRPGPCDISPVCPPSIPAFLVGVPFTLHPYFHDDIGGMFQYTLEADASKLVVNSRVSDIQRIEQTAGSEIPVVREREFRNRTISLLRIPVAPQYRHTLRVYEFDGRAGTRVLVRVYADNDAQPRSTTIETLTVSRHFRRFTTQALPTHPAYLQLDPARLVSLDGVSSLRIEVEPLDDARIWAFVSLTNNDTHHVTTFSAQ